MHSLDAYAQDKLASLRERHLYRALNETLREDGIWVERHNRRFLSFSCNDYLNLTQHPAIKKAAIAAIEEYRGGLGGVTPCHRQSPALAQGSKRAWPNSSAPRRPAFSAPAISPIPGSFRCSSAAMVSCCWTNSRTHAFTPARNYRADTVKTFRHNDVGHARTLLDAHRTQHERALIVTDGVFSMDGDHRPARRSVVASRAIRRMADVRRRPRHRRARRRTRIQLLGKFAHCRSTADGNAVKSNRLLWRLPLRVSARRRAHAQPCTHVDLFDRPAAGECCSSDRRA